MKTFVELLESCEPDAASARFFDAEAAKLHNRSVYDILKSQVRDIHPTVITSLLETLDEHDLEQILHCTDWFEVHILHGRLMERRAKCQRKASAHNSHRLNYPIDEVLDDYIQHRKGKLVEAKRQLRKRFDGLDHDKQEAVMMAFMTYGRQAERNFIYEKLYGDDFWTDAYIPLIQKWWEESHDGKLGKVIVKYCPREYIMNQLEEIGIRCNYATLCLRTGMTPDPNKLPGWTYLYVLKTSGGQLRFREGEQVVLKWVRQFLYEKGQEDPVRSLYDIPYVRRMMAYLGEMGLTDDIMALAAFEKRMRPVPPKDWGTAVIKAIEEDYDFPPFVYKNVE